MKLIIAGGRKIDEELAYGYIVKLRSENHPIIAATEIICGGAKGADQAGKDYGEFYDIAIKNFPAKWKDVDVPGAIIKYNKYGAYNVLAGYMRNEEMAQYGDALLLIWDGISGGSGNMKEQMEKLNKPIYEIIIKNCNF